MESKCTQVLQNKKQSKCTQVLQNEKQSKSTQILQNKKEIKMHIYYKITTKQRLFIAATEGKASVHRLRYYKIKSNQSVHRCHRMKSNQNVDRSYRMKINQNVQRHYRMKKNLNYSRQNDEVLQNKKQLNILKETEQQTK